MCPPIRSPSVLQQLLAALLPIPLGAEARHQQPIGRLLAQPLLPLPDHLRPPEPGIQHSALDGFTIPVATAGGLQGPAKQIVELKGTKTGKGGASAIANRTTLLLEIKELEGIGETVKLQEIGHH